MIFNDHQFTIDLRDFNLWRTGYGSSGVPCVDRGSSMFTEIHRDWVGGIMVSGYLKGKRCGFEAMGRIGSVG